MTKKKKDWFKLKFYPHIGLRLSHIDRIWISSYVKDKQKISSHAFYPFIHQTIKSRKFRRAKHKDGSRSKLRIPSTKIREIFYANHLDSNVYSYYAKIIQKKYEKYITENNFSECVTAYRQIPVNPKNQYSRNKCNIDFAKDIFTYIKNQSPNNLVAITFDITSFFDNLNHKELKKKWRIVIGSGSDLPEDHYNVFRNITKFSYVNERSLFEYFKDKIYIERKPDVIKTKQIAKSKYLKNQRAIAYCLTEDIKKIRQNNLIKNNKYIIKEDGSKELRQKGIPQGSPISALLANLYLIDFDKEANEWIKSINGIYQRYSDDMVIVCDAKHQDSVIDKIKILIENSKLEIQESKTQVFNFNYSTKDKRYFCSEYNLETKANNDNYNFEYLGFQFDGKFTLLKNASLANYYRKMKKSFKRTEFYTYHNRTKTKGEVFKSKLYKRFTHLGATRRFIWKRDKNHTDRFIKSEAYDWGNYLTYAKMAQRIMPENKIRNQIKGHWKIFHDLLKKI